MNVLKFMSAPEQSFHPIRRVAAICLACVAFVIVARVIGQSENPNRGGATGAMQAVDRVVRSLLHQDRLVAISVSMICNRRIIYEGAYGFADREKGLEAKPSTPFYVASVTKALTGTSLILFEAQQKLDLDCPVNNYLMGAKLWSPRWDASAATIRRVANHTGGLTTYHRDCLASAEAGCKASIEIATARYGIVFWPPGDHFDYSNLGYGVLGNLIANVSHKSFDFFWILNYSVRCR